MIRELFGLSYARFKAIAEANSFGTYHVFVGGDVSAHALLRAYCGNQAMVFSSSIEEPDEAQYFTDFPSSEVCVDDVDAEAAVLGVPKEQPFTSIGLPAYVNLDFPEQASDLMKSWQIVAAPQAVTVFDIGILNDLVGPGGICYLAGGEYRMRTLAAEGSALNFLIADRDDVLGYFQYFGLERSKVTGLTGMSGTFVVGETIIGSTSGCRSKVRTVGSDFLAVTFWRWDVNDRPHTFTDGETITGQTSGATAVLGTPGFTEGDVLVVKAYVKDEWIEGMDVREVRPGGSKQLPLGLYFRVVLYNASTTDALRAKVSLILATS